MEKITKNIAKVLFLLMISASLIITGCEEDDEKDPLVGTWILIEMTDGETTYDAAALIEMNTHMTVVFTSTRYTVNGGMGEDVVNESGTWERKDKDTVILTTSDQTTVTLTRDGEYYWATMGDSGFDGKFEKQ